MVIAFYVILMGRKRRVMEVNAFLTPLILAMPLIRDPGA